MKRAFTTKSRAGHYTVTVYHYGIKGRSMVAKAIKIGSRPQAEIVSEELRSGNWGDAPSFGILDFDNRTDLTRLEAIVAQGGFSASASDD